MAESTSSAAAPQPQRSATYGQAGTGGAGAQLMLLNVVRPMNVYPVTESDLRTIGVMNFISTATFSVGGVFVGLAANIWINAAFYNEIPPVARAMVTYGAPLCIGIAILCSIGGITAMIFRRSTWRGVRQSVRLEPVTTPLHS